jgi:hypothetical protein
MVWEIALFLGALSGPIGILFVAYFIQRGLTVYICNSEPHDSPTSLFMAAFIAGMISAFVTAALTVIVSVILIPVCPELLVVFTCLASLGWPVLVAVATLKYRQLRNMPLRFPPKPIQFQTSELLIATITFGIVMLMSFLIVNGDQRAMAAASIYLLTVETLAFLIALDIFRHGEYLKKSTDRMPILIATMALCAIPFAFLLIIFTWKAWRYALWQCRVRPQQI